MRVSPQIANTWSWTIHLTTTLLVREPNGSFAIFAFPEMSGGEEVDETELTESGLLSTPRLTSGTPASICSLFGDGSCN